MNTETLPADLDIFDAVPWTNAKDATPAQSIRNLAMRAAFKYGKRIASVRMSRRTADLALRTDQVKVRSFYYGQVNPETRWQDFEPTDETFAKAIDGLFQPAADFLQTDGKNPGLVEFLGYGGEVVALLHVV